MRFLCDEMLKGLGRWLRAAGHDTAIVEDGLADRTLIERTLIEDRMLLTCAIASWRRGRSSKTACSSCGRRGSTSQRAK